MFGKRGAQTVTASIQKSDVQMPDQLQGKVHFLQMNQTDLDRLKQIEPLLTEHLEAITERHYHMLRQYSHLMQIIEKHTTVDGLAVTFRHYLQSLPHAKLDDAYIAGRKKIGEVHSKIGLAPEWYTGSYLRVYEYLIPAIVNVLDQLAKEVS
ncbi:hypothetical protein BP422_17710 [Brevibacillus formosus]|uniref:Globin-sensor domain-containing protein n=1 Tax=Brevibacillus formosus TaxID=54913 RepID=A0A220MK00_9BACL|nr:protoglobin domain-containing protein [Brevibacillus formosus]ASJ55222.1 hypothetical protein BP422_17710 [Brevibacillus formosus]